MMIVRLMKQRHAVVCLSCILAGCGQTLSITVERICDANAQAYLHTDRQSDDQKAPRIARECAAQFPRLTVEVVDGILSSLTGVVGVGATTKFHQIRLTSEEQLDRITNYAVDLTVGELRKCMALSRARLQELDAFNVPADIFAALGYQPGEAQEKIREMQAKKQIHEIENALQMADRAKTRVNALESEFEAKLKYGGYRSDSIFLINPGSREYEKVLANHPGERPTLVFSKVEAIAAGDSVLLAVQENPAYFTMRYVSSNPAEIIRNMLLAINRVMRVAAAYTPTVHGVGAALGFEKTTTRSGSNPYTETVSMEAAESAILVFDEALKNVNDEELQILLRKIKSNPVSLTDEDKLKLNSKVQELMAALGAGAAALPN